MEESEIVKEIISEGYLIPKPIKISPSYYKLDDGTIISALVHPHYMLKDPHGMGGNTTNIVSAFVPKDHRHPEKFTPYTVIDMSKDVVEQDVKFTPIVEDFSEYDLGDGAIMSIKSVISQISKTKYVTMGGEPIFSVQVTPINKLKMPEKQ